MNLVNIQGKLSRSEMKKIMGGNADEGIGDGCPVGKSCRHTYWNQNGYCSPFGDSCRCYKDGAATYSSDCIIYA